MSSSFKGLDLFGSGPHRFGELKQGQLTISDVALGGFSPDTLYVGLVEVRVVVTGRLVASGESALWTLRDAVTDELVDPPAPGTLVDLHGRSWSDVSLVRFEPGEVTDRGRVVSLAYEAEFIRFNQYPQ